MKKIVALALVLALCLGVTSALADRMMVHVYALCYDTNHVGSEWNGYYSVGGYQVYDGDVVELNVDSYDFLTQIYDNDSVPDYGEALDTFKVTANRLNKGFTVEQYLTVTEDRGSYKDYWCEWYVYYEFTPVGNAWVIN